MPVRSSPLWSFFEFLLIAPKDIDPYESPLHFFASQLRRHRLRLDLTQEQLGRRVNASLDLIEKVAQQWT